MIMVKTMIAASGLSIAVACLGGTAVAVASPTSSVSVQGQGGDSRAAVRSGSFGVTDADGTQGSFAPAVDGTQTGPLMVAVPQFKSITN